MHHKIMNSNQSFRKQNKTAGQQCIRTGFTNEINETLDAVCSAQVF